MNIVLLASTPIVKSPGTVPYRFVLVKVPMPDKSELTKEFVVWTEVFTESQPHKHVAYHNGSYFPVHPGDNPGLAFANAYERWAHRVGDLQAYLSYDYDRCTVLTLE